MSEEHHSRSSSSGSRASSASMTDAASSPYSTVSEKSSCHTVTHGDLSSDDAVFYPTSSPRARDNSEAALSELYIPRSQDEAAALQIPKATTPPSESLIVDPETDFDKLLREYKQEEQLIPRKKPKFVPVLYSAEDPPQKFRRLCARAHEFDLRQKLKNSGLTAKEIDVYATSASYYPGLPGSRYQTLDRALSFSMTPPRISFSSSEGDSPNYLFRDIPNELPKKKHSKLSLPSSSVLPTTPDRRPIAVGYKTPERSSMDVDHLSPAFDRMTVRRKRHLQNKSLESPVLPSSNTPKNKPVAQNVVSINAGSLENLLEPVQLPEQQDSRLSSKESISTRASSNQPSVPIVLLVPGSVVRKYFESIVKFIKEYRVEVAVGKLEHRVTHVVLDEDIKLEKGNIKVEHIQAIGFQKYLVYPSWIIESLSKGMLLDPANFEAVLSSRFQVPPSRISRNSEARLFRGYVFLCGKPFGNKISLDQLVDLLVYNDGAIAFEPNDFAKHQDKIRLCIVGEFFNNEENKEKLRQKLEKWNCAKVRYNWIFEVFATCSLQPLLGHLFDTSLDEARIAGVPEELLK